VGYSGGTSENPNYYSLGNHSETVQIEYDPERISYRDLLDVFWRSHDPYYPSSSTQYMSVVFYHNDEQKRQVVESRDELETETIRTIYTRIVPASTFYLAEDYHQKYYLQQHKELAEEFKAIYPDFKDFVKSTSVARINGYAGGYGTPETLQKELGSLGLSPEGIDRVLELAERGLVLGCPVPSSAGS
jgi:peptide-methionine (S)-S-oxide reductase